MAIEWKDSAKRPKTENCQIPLYVVTWTSKNGRKTGNSWTSKAYAEKVLQEKQAAGTYIDHRIEYCGMLVNL